MREHKILERTIRRCGCDKRAGDGSRYRWYEVVSEGGAPVRFEAQSPHYYTLAQAREAIAWAEAANEAARAAE